MSVRPVIVSSIVAACSVAGAAHAADDPATVLTRMAGNYTSAKAYSTVIITKQQGQTKDGKKFSLTKTQVMKFRAPNLVNIAVSFAGTGAAAGQLAQGNQTVVGDGRTLFSYFPIQKTYFRKPDLPNITVMDLLDVLKRLPLHGGPNVKMLAPSSLGGRPVFVIEISPIMPKNLKPEQQAAFREAVKNASPLRMMIDKQSFLLLKLAETSKAGSVDIELTGQTFTPALQNSAFTFTPPPGSREIKPGAPPAGGPAPAPPAPRR